MPINVRTEDGSPLNISEQGDGTSDLVVDAKAGYSLGTTQKIALSATAAASSAWGTSGTVRLRIVATSAFHAVAGTNPTATTSDPYYPANVPEVIEITGGQKLSVIQDSATGNAYITQLSYA
jgi:hypothetical protein